MKQITTWTLTLATLCLLIAAPATAATRSIELNATPPTPFPVWGMAQTTVKGKFQSFKVRIDAGASNGTVLVVAVMLKNAADANEWIEVAKTEVELGSALISLDNDQHISPVFPVRDIRGVQVRYRDRPVLEGWFAGIGTTP